MIAGPRSSDSPALTRSRRLVRLLWLLPVIGCLAVATSAGAAEKSAVVHVTEPQLVDLALDFSTMGMSLQGLEKNVSYRSRADVEVCLAALDWALRHRAFPSPDSVAHAKRAVALGKRRLEQLRKGDVSWQSLAGRTIRGYQSEIDDTYQPYALTLPNGFRADSQQKWPLHVVLHGRDDSLSEIKFIHQHEGKPAEKDADWIQLDVYGRGCNAYRWAGEADVLEALKDVQGRYRIDDRRIVLHGFSMGGAGAWHLGLHYPSRWCSVGPGAGFIDFYDYQKVSQKLPPYQDATLSIYDAVRYAGNAFNVPVCTYGGELDKQLVASTRMKTEADRLKAPMQILIGPKVGHRFEPESQRKFMDFHREQQRTGRAVYPGTREIRFTTFTVKYNNCEWVTVEEQFVPYRESNVTAKVDDEGKLVTVETRNVGVLRLARDIATEAQLDGQRLPLGDAADRLLPDVYFESDGDHWRTLGYDESLGFNKNRDLHKRKNLQGPIDDAFMSPFVCVRGTGTPWSPSQAAWSNWTLERFTAEFDRWFHGRVPVISDREVTPELIQSKNLILFGDPGSNSQIAQIVKRLPFGWEKDTVTVAGTRYDTATHGVACIYPNPQNPRRYIVINSGHTFHAPDFRNSNAWLFPRCGDIAVLKFAAQPGKSFSESIVWADLFDFAWRLPKEKKVP